MSKQGDESVTTPPATVTSITMKTWPHCSFWLACRHNVFAIICWVGSLFRCLSVEMQIQWFLQTTHLEGHINPFTIPTAVMRKMLYVPLDAVKFSEKCINIYPSICWRISSAISSKISKNLATHECIHSVFL